MASNQTSNHRRTNNGAHNQPAQPAQSTNRPSPTQYVDEATQEVSSAMNKFGQQASQYYERGKTQLRECISGREGTAVLVAMAAGVGVGLVIGAALGQSHPREELSWRDRVAAEGFGRRLMDRIEGMIPDALAQHFAR